MTENGSKGVAALKRCRKTLPGSLPENPSRYWRRLRSRPRHGSCASSGSQHGFSTDRLKPPSKIDFNMYIYIYKLYYIILYYIILYHIIVHILYYNIHWQQLYKPSSIPNGPFLGPASGEHPTRHGTRRSAAAGVLSGLWWIPKTPWLSHGDIVGI